MAVLHVTGFRGEVPRNSPRLIGNPFAQIAQNCKLYAGRIDPMRKPALVHESALTQEIRTFFHYHYKDSATWLAWPQVIDIVQSPIAGDERGRLYFSGLGELAMTTWADGVEGSSGPFPAKWFRLGVENPLAAPTAVASGGSAPNETRVYVWTWVTRYAEESGPSPAATVTGNIDGTWTISGFDAPYKNSGTVSAVASASGTAVATVDSTYGMTAGCVVVLAGTNMAAWNTRVTVKEVTDATHFTFETKTLGTFSGNATWALLNPHNTTGLKRRIYRTSGTNATPRLVAELDISQSSYADTKPTKDLLINFCLLYTSAVSRVP